MKREFVWTPRCVRESDMSEHWMEGGSGKVDVQAVTPGKGIPLNGGRRRLFRGLGGGAGVLMAVSAKSALGGTLCQSPSAMMSGNVSHQPANTSCSGGLSPGYWVQPQHFDAWTAAGVQYPTFSPAIVACSTGTAKVAMSAIVVPGSPPFTTITGVFGSCLLLSNNLQKKAGDPTQEQADCLWSIIYSPTSYQDGPYGVTGQVARALVCAWLNAKYFTGSFASGTEQYPISPAEVQDMWHQLWTTGYYCPSNITNCNSTTGMTADNVKNYIESMYDINAAVPNYCTNGSA